GVLKYATKGSDRLRDRMTVRYRTRDAQHHSEAHRVRSRIYGKRHRRTRQLLRSRPRPAPPGTVADGHLSVRARRGALVRSAGLGGPSVVGAGRGDVEAEELNRPEDS